MHCPQVELNFQVSPATLRPLGVAHPHSTPNMKTDRRRVVS